ncbi:MAG: PQQ-dependent sugar dehydrogenase [Methylococcaceae bacterium]|nr:PQQ-dependent sugar dehydrogenase [Methylococcaceae bacterium]
MLYSVPLFQRTRIRLALSLGITLMASACGGAPGPIDLGSIRLPPGFSIAAYTTQVPGARSMSLGDDGTVYVGTLDQGKVYAVRDADGDGRAEQVSTVASGLNAPNGVAWLAGDLYIAEVSRISKIGNIKAHRERPATPEVIYDGYPSDKHHGWKYLRTGPDGKLYTAVGAPCNVCKPEKEVYATLTRLDPDGKNFEIFARGLRNSVGFDWHPVTHELWLTDNGRDWLGNDLPPDELNHAAKAGLHFGFPYCHGKDIADPEFGKEAACSQFTAPEWSFPAHVAALGLRFYTGAAFPVNYRQQLFVAQHGSWNRSQPQGYRVVLVRFEQGKPVAEEAFAEGWLKPDGTVTGRPVDILQMPDGALLVSDDQSGAIYRIAFQPATQVSKP